VPKNPLSIRAVACLCWFIIIVLGFAVMMNYQSTQGAVGQTPRQWPAQARVKLDSQRDTLVMFVHPQCACTEASLDELNRALARCSVNVAAQIWFFQPVEPPTSWTQSTLRHNAAAIPGLIVQDDVGGEQARIFGAETSGYVVLYNPRGQLLFKGGITSSRGHEGDNTGESAIVALLSGKKSEYPQTPVYGCSLFGRCQSSFATNSK
jgi:hypothetical protein